MTQNDPNASNLEPKQSYGIEELQVVGEQLVSKVKELARESNVRRIIIKQEGHTILEIPLVVGVAGVLIAPVWAAIGVLGALIAKCSIEVIRADSPIETAKEKVEDIKDGLKPNVR